MMKNAFYFTSKALFVLKIFMLKNMLKNFFEKSYKKRGGETSPIPFSEKLKLNISLDQ